MSAENEKRGAELIELARHIASRAHSGQHRRDGYTPYINHPAAVAAKLSGQSAVVIATAWLHDVIEDTDETTESLSMAGLPDSVIQAVALLTKPECCCYEDYLLDIRSNWIARKVKIADMLHNLSDSRTDKQIIKYAKGLLTLTAQASSLATVNLGGRFRASQVGRVLRPHYSNEFTAL